jgi:hypothetical protein
MGKIYRFGFCLRTKRLMLTPTWMPKICLTSPGFRAGFCGVRPLLSLGWTNPDGYQPHRELSHGHVTGRQVHLRSHDRGKPLGIPLTFDPDGGINEDSFAGWHHSFLRGWLPTPQRLAGRGATAESWRAKAAPEVRRGWGIMTATGRPCFSMTTVSPRSICPRIRDGSRLSSVAVAVEVM